MRPGTRMWMMQLRMLQHDLDMLRQARERAEGLVCKTCGATGVHTCDL